MISRETLLRPWQRGALLLCGCLLALCCAIAVDTPNPKPRCLLFSQATCAPCKRLERELLRRAKQEGLVVSENESADIQLVDLDKRPDLLEKHEPTQTPSLAIVLPDGTELFHSRDAELNARRVCEITKRWQAAQSQRRPR